MVERKSYSNISQSNCDKVPVGYNFRFNEIILEGYFVSDEVFFNTLPSINDYNFTEEQRQFILNEEEKNNLL